MITIELQEKYPGIQIQNDKNYGDILLHCRNYDEEKEVLVDLVERLLKNNDQRRNMKCQWNLKTWSDAIIV